METWKVTIKVSSNISTPLIGDTIFGHIIWGIAHYEGEEAVNAFIKALPNKPFVISSAFPSGYLPKPQLNPNFKFENIEYKELKKFKKIKYIPAKLFFDKPSITIEDIYQYSSEIDYNQIALDYLHNTCDRLGSGTLEDVGLFTSTTYWFKNKNNNVLFDIYVLSDYSDQIIKKYFEHAFSYGYGANSSVGSGNINIINIINIKMPEHGNRAMALGPFVIIDSKIIPLLDLRSDIFIRRGKIGAEFGLFMNPFKKPIAFFNEGSTFLYEQINCQYIGNIIHNIHSDPRIIQQGWAPIIRYNEVES